MREFKVTMEDDMSIDVSPLEGKMKDATQDLFTDILMNYLKMTVKVKVEELLNRLAGTGDSIETELTKISYETLEMFERVHGATEESEDIKNKFREVIK